MYVLILAALVQDTFAAGAVYIALSGVVWVVALWTNEKISERDTLIEMRDRLMKVHSQ